MSGNPALGQFLVAEDVNQVSMLAAYSMQNLSERDTQMIKKILDCNWVDEEQMVANLLQNPFLIPEKMRVNCLIKGLSDVENPYYILSAALGIQRLKFEEKDKLKLLNNLRKAVFNEQGTISMRAFITMQANLKYPDDLAFFLDILQMKKSPLHDGALSWLVLRVKDKKELLSALKKGNICEELVKRAEKKIDEHCECLAHGEESPVMVEVFSYIPSLVDFDAMLDKEDALTDFFEDLDADNDNKLSAEDVKTFLEDIGKDTPLEEVIKEMKQIGVDDTGKIDKDGFIEMMFPKFQVH